MIGIQLLHPMEPADRPVYELSFSVLVLIVNCMIQIFESNADVVLPGVHILYNGIIRFRWNNVAQCFPYIYIYCGKFNEIRFLGTSEFHI